MEGKIILISNRGVREKRSGSTLFKNALTKTDHRLRCASVNTGSRHKKYRLTLCDEGQEQSFLNDSVSDVNGKPWVFFLHGNNQTLDKNLKKCFALRDHYDVNVLAFSWPSTHHGKIRKWLNLMPRNPSIGRFAKRQFKAKVKQYKKARKNARESSADLRQALEMAASSFNNGSVTHNFICHSLGNYLLQHTADLAQALATFNHVVLHQGDADDENHRQWVDRIGKGANVVITINEKDKVLKASNAFNHRSLKNQRLGNVSKTTSSGSPTYRDFTGEDDLGFSGHTMFTLSAEENSQVNAFFKPLLTT